MKLVLAYNNPGHEGEYVVFISSENPLRIGAPQYADLKMQIEFDGAQSILGDDYIVLNRGTRLEIIGPRNDELIRRAFHWIGYHEVEFK